jgi:hypothetical protein
MILLDQFLCWMGVPNCDQPASKRPDIRSAATYPPFNQSTTQLSNLSTASRLPRDHQDLHLVQEGRVEPPVPRCAAGDDIHLEPNLAEYQA